MITAIYFGPDFLQNENPNFILSGSTESPLFFELIERESVIHYNLARLTINEYFDNIDTCVISFLCQKQILNSFRIFGYRTYSGQEVAIATVSLFDIVRPDVVEKLIVSLSIDFSRPLPYKVFPILDAFLSSNHRIKNNTFPGRETIILPVSLARSDDFLPLDLFTKPLRDVGEFWNAI